MPYCKRCGRPLSDPISIQREFGNYCWKLVTVHNNGKGVLMNHNPRIANCKSVKEAIQFKRLSDGRLATNFDHINQRHSPTGMETGYSGSGCADTALNILLNFMPLEKAQLIYQKFKFDFIAGLNTEEVGKIVEIQTTEILDWIKKHDTSS